ncbi:MAG TPA: hypothetical protein ENN78_00660 [Candidatus Omnitrophica bacterium]|nr:hypothetical protein [Candidatus Omnitrophota bacterium]
MKFKIVLLLLVIAIVFSVCRYALTDDGRDKLSLLEKIDLLIDKQDEVLSRLDTIHEELVKIRIRVSRNL